MSVILVQQKNGSLTEYNALFGASQVAHTLGLSRRTIHTLGTDQKLGAKRVAAREQLFASRSVSAKLSSPTTVSNASKEKSGASEWLSWQPTRG